MKNALSNVLYLLPTVALFVFCIVGLDYYIKNENRLDIGDCFIIPEVEHKLFKIRGKMKYSYLAGKYLSIHSDDKFDSKYPAENLTSVSYDTDIHQLDCMDPGNEDWNGVWEESILREYEDRKSRYDKDAVVPKVKK